MNLMLNGIEAMKDTGGELTIKSERGENGELLMSITDSGVGLPAERRTRFSMPSLRLKRRAPAWA